MLRIHSRSFFAGVLVTFSLWLATAWLGFDVVKDSKPRRLAVNVDQKDVKMEMLMDTAAIHSEASDGKMPWEEMMAQRHRDRTQKVAEYCHKSGLHRQENATTSRFLLVSEEHKIMWCIVLKVGASQWKEIMGKLEKKDPMPETVFDRGAFKFWHRYPAKERQEMLRTYHKFMFVRNPFDRLLSAYRDKFERQKAGYMKRFGTRIIRMYRPNATEHALRTGDDVTFLEFAKFAANNKEKDDAHWQPYHEVCHPCSIPYDYIGHFDTYKEDADYILKRAGVDHLVTFPPFGVSETPREFLRHYRTIPEEIIMRLREIFKHDLGLFDYPFPGPLEPLLHHHGNPSR